MRQTYPCENRSRSMATTINPPISHCKTGGFPSQDLLLSPPPALPCEGADRGRYCGRLGSQTLPSALRGESAGRVSCPRQGGGETCLQSIPSAERYRGKVEVGGVFPRQHRRIPLRPSTVLGPRLSTPGRVRVAPSALPRRGRPGGCSAGGNGSQASRSPPEIRYIMPAALLEPCSGETAISRQHISRPAFVGES
jgi:hypothetical protein